ncbi:LPXTG cell wall anchor domain-containing protein [Leuconostoc fallax]
MPHTGTAKSNGLTFTGFGLLAGLAIFKKSRKNKNDK